MRSLYYRYCWHRVSNLLFFRYSHRSSSLKKAVYNSKTFIPHAASLHQAFAHCGRFSTAATRRCLGSVSVPVCRATLARPVGIAGLVGHYPANYLIPRRPVPRRRSFGRTRMPSSDVAGDYPQFPAAIPNLGVGYRRLTPPSATGPIRRPAPFDLHA